MKLLVFAAFIFISRIALADNSVPFRLVNPTGMSVTFQTAMSTHGLYQNGQLTTNLDPKQPYCSFSFPIAFGAGTTLQVSEISGQGSVAGKSFETYVYFQTNTDGSNSAELDCLAATNADFTLQQVAAIFGGQIQFSGYRVEADSSNPLTPQTSVQFNVAAKGRTDSGTVDEIVLFQNGKILNSWGTGPLCVLGDAYAFTVRAGQTVAITDSQVYYDHNSDGQGNQITYKYEFSPGGPPQYLECNPNNDSEFALPTLSDFAAAVGNSVQLNN